MKLYHKWTLRKDSHSFNPPAYIYIYIYIYIYRLMGSRFCLSRRTNFTQFHLHPMEVDMILCIPKRTNQMTPFSWLLTTYRDRKWNSWHTKFCGHFTRQSRHCREWTPLCPILHVTITSQILRAWAFILFRLQNLAGKKKKLLKL